MDMHFCGTYTRQNDVTFLGRLMPYVVYGRKLIDHMKILDVLTTPQSTTLNGK